MAQSVDWGERREKVLPEEIHGRGISEGDLSFGLQATAFEIDVFLLRYRIAARAYCFSNILFVAAFHRSKGVFLAENVRPYRSNGSAAGNETMSSARRSPSQEIGNSFNLAVQRLQARYCGACATEHDACTAS